MVRGNGGAVCRKCERSCRMRPDGLCGHCRHKILHSKDAAHHSHKCDTALPRYDVNRRVRIMQLVAADGLSPSELDSEMAQFDDDMTPEQERVFREQHCDPNYGVHGGRPGAPRTGKTARRDSMGGWD